MPLCAADTDADHVAEAALAEMHQLIRAKLDTLGDMNSQIDESWAAQAAVTDTYRRPPGSPERPA